MEAKQGRGVTGYSYTETTMMPYWVNFYEANYTFLIYPPNTEPVVYIDLYCCNWLDECAVNSFSIAAQTT